MTITKNTTIKLDGKSRIIAGTDRYTWDDRMIGPVTVPSMASKDITLTVNLTGSNWDAGLLGLGGRKLFVVINDAATGSNRNISQIELVGERGSEVNLTHTSVGYIMANGAVDTITTGTGWVSVIDLGGGDNVLEIGEGGARSVLAGDGNDEVTVGAGNVGNIDVAGGANIITTGDGKIRTIETRDGDQTIMIGAGGARYISLGAGNHDVTIDGNVRTLVADDGDGIYVINADMQSLSLGAGQNDVTVNGEFLASVQTGAGDDTFYLNGEVGQLDAGRGNNTIVMSDFYIGSIITHNVGNDVLHVGTAGVGEVQLARGDDIVYFVAQTDPESGGSFSGGRGSDTLGNAYVDTFSFEDFDAGGVDISLAATGQQDTGAGLIRIADFENLVGTAFDDRLAGDSKTNVLTGGDGADTFVFGDGGGEDEVADFSVADGDVIDLQGVSGIDDFADLAGDHLTQDGDDAVIDNGAGVVIRLRGIDMAELTAGQFIFA